MGVSAKTTFRDTVSTVMKIHGVHSHRSMVVDKFGLRIGGEERIIFNIYR